MLKRGNVDTNLPDASGNEVIQELAAFPGVQVRVERIVSDGQATPDGFWYDQAWGEWVVVLKGGAVLEFEEPPAEEFLRQGDWLFIPPHRRHRVRSTEVGTVWLAVHGGGDA